MDKYQETSQTWNKLASLYNEKFMDITLYDETYDVICASISQGKAKILEIGCGPGNITRYLLSKRPDFDIFGIDIAPNMIALAQQNNPNATFAVMDCRDISSISTTFDGIVCGFCLPFISQEDCPTFISDCSNLLNPHGLIYLSFVAGDPAQSTYKVGSSGDRIFFHFHDLETLQDHLAEHGFTGLKTYKVQFKRSETEFEAHTILMGWKG